MSWTPLAERFTDLPLILSGPIVRRVELHSVTVWLALKEPRRVTLRIYARSSEGELIQRFEGTHHTIRLGDHLYIVAVTAQTTSSDALLKWGQLYYYDLFFDSESQEGSPALSAPGSAAHLDTSGILMIDPTRADPLQQLVYPGHPLPSFMIPPEDVNELRFIHGSCRKSHGIGKEALSTLDTILELAAEGGTDRPQMLFLTGDQVYADDVAAQFLFTLIDIGNFLLQGNKEEILPGVNVPGHKLAPGGRSDVVHNRAMFTTTTPQSQLMTVSEYTAMYMCAWSHLLWPQELPTIEEMWQAYPELRPQSRDDEQKAREQHEESRKRLHEFHSTLPKVRRALANIATYMICDDHEITDDWFLDGAWCKQVLASPLGRRIVRNGLITYALFQGWGNTPEQFAEKHGFDFLKAIDAWRGDEADPLVESIEKGIDLPSSFSGTGTLAHYEQGLRWHYSYSGPRFQVVVMNTRTHRFYRSPSEFPGLLSPNAIQEQIASAMREDAEVTIIISATPVLGVDFVESIQFWSRWRVKDNYAFDREAWALEWDTFQHFLRAVSAMRRVVFLSGDVHYAFGSSMEYWDEHTNTTAKFVDYTSSPFCNEDAGAHIAVLAVVYPWLQHLLRHQDTPTLDYFAWDINSGDHRILNDVLALIHKRIYLFWWSIPRLVAAYRSPYEIILPAHGWLKGAFKAFPPDRIYRLHYLRNALAQVTSRRKYSLRRRLATLVIRSIRLSQEGLALLEISIKKIRQGLLYYRTRRVERVSDATSGAARELLPLTIRSTTALEHNIEKQRNKLVTTIFRYAGWP
ncbi:MAG TPA: hypothetical protein VH593_11270, partial [Ktedonobacteraceae bacterium]